MLGRTTLPGPRGPLAACTGILFSHSPHLSPEEPAPFPALPLPGVGQEGRAEGACEAHRALLRGERERGRENMCFLI